MFFPLNIFAQNFGNEVDFIYCQMYYNYDRGLILSIYYWSFSPFGKQVLFYQICTFHFHENYLLNWDDKESLLHYSNFIIFLFVDKNHEVPAWCLMLLQQNFCSDFWFSIFFSVIFKFFCDFLTFLWFFWLFFWLFFDFFMYAFVKINY